MRSSLLRWLQRLGSAALRSKAQSGEGAIWSGPEAGARHAAPSPPAVGEPWDLHLRYGSAQFARPPVLLRTLRRPKTYSAAHRPEVAETWEGGPAPARGAGRAASGCERGSAAHPPLLRSSPRPRPRARAPWRATLNQSIGRGLLTPWSEMQGPVPRPIPG